MALGRPLFSLLLFAACISLPLSAIEIFLAPPAIEGASSPPHQTLQRAISELDRDGVIQIKKVKADSSGLESPRTSLEAAALCEARQIELLLYGYLRWSEYTWEGEVKLYDHRERRVLKRFFSRDDAAESERFIRDLAEKIVSYLYDDLGLASAIPESPPERNILAVPFQLGYPIPCAGDWDRLTMGIGRIETGLLFTPLRPLWQAKGKSWEFQTGLLCAYTLNTNTPEYESFLLHSLRLNIPARAVGRVSAGRRIILGAGIALQADFLDQERAHYGEYRTLAVAPGFSLEAGYRFLVSRRFSIGIRTAVEATLYETVQVNLVPGISGQYEFKPRKEEE